MTVSTCARFVVKPEKHEARRMAPKLKAKAEFQ